MQTPDVSPLLRWICLDFSTRELFLGSWHLAEEEDVALPPGHMEQVGCTATRTLLVFNSAAAECAKVLH